MRSLEQIVALYIATMFVHLSIRLFVCMVQGYIVIIQCTVAQI